MRRKILLIALAIALVAGLVVGGTMAWFEAKAEAPVNEFTAGTVMIEAGDEFVYPDFASMGNVNPGDAFKKCVKITNTGTKDIRLRMLSELDFEIDWDRVENHFDELCFSEEWTHSDALEEAVLEALEEGRITNPAEAEGEPNGPFDKNDDLVIPIMVTPEEFSDWVMKDVEGQKVFFYDDVLQPDQTTELCVIVVFDGPWMGNLWQGAEFTLGGTFQAVQSSNDAPKNVWGEGVWENYKSLIEVDDLYNRLSEEFSPAYANYFFEEGEFIYAYLCEMKNGNGFVSTGSAWGEGEPYGTGLAMYFEYTMGETMDLELELQEGAKRVAVGDVWVDGNGYLQVRVKTQNYDFNGNQMVMTEAHLYASTEIPTVSSPGLFSYVYIPGGTFDDYTFNVTHIHQTSDATPRRAPDLPIEDVKEGETIYLALHAVTGYIE